MTGLPRAGETGSAAVTPADAHLARWRLLTVAAVAAIVVLSVAWEWQLAPLRPGGSLLVLKALPLAALLPGLARGRLRTFQICSMLILAYLAEGVVRGMSDSSPSSVLGWLETVLATTAFGSVLAYVRSLQGAANTPARERS